MSGSDKLIKIYHICFLSVCQISYLLFALLPPIQGGIRKIRGFVICCSLVEKQHLRCIHETTDL